MDNDDNNNDDNDDNNNEDDDNNGRGIIRRQCFFSTGTRTRATHSSPSLSGTRSRSRQRDGRYHVVSQKKTVHVMIDDRGRLVVFVQVVLFFECRSTTLGE